ncbi:YjjG family noncanonical pyrimidine nucleotidase [Aurantibacter crassamenti]|uniref:YjjG family noncanonical pyrimidine nucleotidase n=1 Tax=Aurantibacter crassamenti TaxID=1837375 RepID=UPI001939D020|nr:YjjG family noncanonical pyrimidine nucleotidase [Aurantibacter crassamenti]MBM1106098.1 YjjG family noncanonical pyrimidine nucleotidase [Aurantibacter crassamenti]
MFRNKVTDIFFDLDHTLWDFDKNSALTFSKIFKETNIDIDLDAFLSVYIPQNLAFWKLYREERISKSDLRYQRLKTVFDKLGAEVSDNTINILSKAYIEHLSSFNHLLPGTTEILEYLQPKYRLHIITNGFHEVQHKKMRNSNILNYFNEIIDSEMAGVKKPNQLIFDLALKRANVQSFKALMIGDNLEADIMGANAAGFHTLHINSHKQPQHKICPIIDHLHEIKSYL